MILLDLLEELVTGVEDELVLEVNQSSKNLAAAPLLSPLMSLLFLLMEVPCVAYHAAKGSNALLACTIEKLQQCHLGINVVWVPGSLLCRV